MLDFSISSLTQGFNSTIKIAELTGFIESLNVKIDKLINKELKSGIRDLQSSERTDNIERKFFYIYEARRCFRNAISLEKNERLCLAYLGYIYCLGCMNEKENLRYALKEFSRKHFQVDFWSYINFKEDVIDVFVYELRQYLFFNLFELFKLKKWKLFAEEFILSIKLFIVLFIEYFDPEYRRLKRRYRNKKNVEKFNELENRIKYFKKRVIVHNEMIRYVEKSKTKQAKDTIKDSRKILMLIEKQIQIFDLQKEAYNYANQL